MKSIPQDIKIRNVMYGDGAKGMAIQVMRNDEYGVQCDAVRESRHHDFVQTWTSDFLPDQEFKTFALLRISVNAAGDALKRFEPKILRVEPKGLGTGGCWRCHDGPWEHSVRVKTGWRAGDEKQVPCCSPCLPAVGADPLAAIESRHKWVREHPIKF